MTLKYRTLVDTLKEEISRLSQDGNRHLPTELSLMQTYGVSRQTVRKALSVLQEEGLVERRQGSGTFIARSILQAGAMSRGIAILLPSVTQYACARQLWEIQAILSSEGYPAQAYSTENLVSQERKILQGFLEKPVRALLVCGVRTALPNPNCGLYQKLTALGTSVLFLGNRYPALSHLPRVAADDREGGYLLTSHLLSLGHKKIAGIFRLDDLSGHERYEGCLRALCEYGLPFDDRSFLWYGASPVEAPDPRSILSFVQIQLADCTAVICQNETVASMLIRELSRLGIAVPGRISVAAFGSGFPAERSPVPLTCLDTAEEKPWEIAARCLLQLADGKTVSSVSCPWTLIRRSSDGPA